MSRRIALGLSLWLLGCNAKLVRLEHGGDHDAVIAAADHMRWRPARAGARAYARALEAEGQYQHARAVLLGDFRRHAQLGSLLELAALEQRMGRDGMAAAHYTRVATIDRTLLRGRDDVCALLRARADAWIRIGEGDAALDDLDRVRAACGEQESRPRRAATAIAAAQVDARVQASLPCRDCDVGTDRDLERDDAAAMARATEQGPLSLRRLAAEHGRELPAATIVELLLADIRGELGFALVDDDELRGWIGELPDDAFVPLLTTRSAPEAAWLRLQLERVLGRSPDGGAVSSAQRMLWADRAAMIDGIVDWRRLAYVDDGTGVEQDLVARWRPQARRDAPSGPVDRDVIAPTSGHWSQRVEPTARSVPELLLYARLRDAAGDRELSLATAIAVLRGAIAAGLPDATTWLQDEVARALAWGRPWRALALASASEQADLEPLRAAAATAVLVEELLCEGPCADGAADRTAVEVVLGGEWLGATRSKLRELAFARAHARAAAGACPGLDEALVPGARSPLGDALAAAREPAAVDAAERIAAGIEADPTLVCNARLLLPLLAARGAGPTAARLSELLSHAPELRVAPLLLVGAELALQSGDGMRAAQLGTAAAAAARDAAGAWRELARMAAGHEARDVLRLALRELVLHAHGAEAEAARHAMLIGAIEDGWLAWGPRDTPAGREAVRRHVVEAAAGLPQARRAAWRERLVASLAPRIHDDTAIEVTIAAVLPGELLARHPVAATRLGRRELPRAPAFASDQLLALQVAARRVPELPSWVSSFGAPNSWTHTRVALATHAREWTVRRRLAIGALVLGDARTRASAAAQVVTMAPPGSRVALERVLLERPAALRPDHDGGWRPTAVVDDDVWLLRVLFALPLAPALWLPEPETP